MASYQVGGHQRSLRKGLCLIEGLILLAAPFVALALLRAWGVVDPQGLLIREVVFFAATGLAGLVATGLYNPRLRSGLAGILLRLGLVGVFQGGVIALGGLIAPSLVMDGSVLLLSLALALTALAAVRASYLRLSNRNNRPRRVLVLGAGPTAARILDFRRRTDFIGIERVGFRPSVGDEIDSDRAVPVALRLPDREPLVSQVESLAVDQVVVAVDDRRGMPVEALLRCRTRGTDVVEVVDFIEQELGLLELSVMNPGWLVFAPGFNKRSPRRWTKRLFDVVVSASLLTIVAPLMIAVAAINWISSRGRWPVFYRQTRLGEEGQPFELLKFRSMRPDAEANGAQWAAAGDARVTRFGRFMRQYRIDELPQLINILAGQMSFVGPRPERPEFVGDLQRQLPFYAERHRVKPGLTGWAQVRYPYGASTEDAHQKLRFDLYYAKNHSFYLDVAILLQTAEVVLMGKGAR